MDRLKGAFNIAVLARIAFDRRPQMWLDGPEALLISCQFPVPPLMRGHIPCDLSLPESVPWTLPKTFEMLP